MVWEKHRSMNNKAMNETTAIESEAALIVSAMRHTEKFSILYTRYYDQVFRFVQKRVRNTSLAKDLTSDVFLKALKGIGNYECRGKPFASWLMTIASNTIRMHFRRAGRMRFTELKQEDIAFTQDHTDQEAKERLIKSAIAVLDTFPGEMKRLIEMRFFREMSFKQIARELKIEVPAAKMRTYRILKLLRKKLVNL